MTTCSGSCSVDADVSRIMTSGGGAIGSFERNELQSAKCSFGTAGICCRLCSNGPCRVTDKSPLGVCGANRDTIVARNFLRSVAAGAACYLHVAENAARALQHSNGNVSPPALARLAKRLGINSAGRDNAGLAIVVADAVLADLYRPKHEKMRLIERLAPAKERKRWSEIGLMPGGAKAEVFEAFVKTSTNLNSNATDLLLHCLRLGVITGYYGLVLTNSLNDAILGDPEIRRTDCGLGTINPETLNIAVTGHQQARSMLALERLIDAGLKSAALEAGASGVSVVGLTCVGQDMQSRAMASSIAFSGHAGDNYTAEAALMTGAIDLLVSDFNCTIQGLDEIAVEQGIPEVCIDEVAMLPNAVVLPLDGDWSDTAEMVVGGAAKHFAKRKGVELSLPRTKIKTLTGMTENSLVDFLGGSLDGLLDLIKTGRIRGLAGVLGCSNLKAGHGFLTEGLTRELIKRDILVLSAGCTSGVLGNCGLMDVDAAGEAGESLAGVCRELGIAPVLNFGPCLGIGRVEQVTQLAAETLGIELSQLPVAISAPEWLEEQALADGAFGLAAGFSLHLGTAPAVTGSDLVVEVLTGSIRELTRGVLHIEPDAVKAAEWMSNVIEQKRQALGLD